MNSDEETPAPDRWDRALYMLSFEPRRQIIVSLLDASEEQRLPLPDAADSPNISVNPSRFEAELRHQHLPKLEEADYIWWDPDRFYVQRGPNFDEVGAIMNILLDSVDQYPTKLIRGCDVLEQL